MTEASKGLLTSLLVTSAEQPNHRGAHQAGLDIHRDETIYITFSLITASPPDVPFVKSLTQTTPAESPCEWRLNCLITATCASKSWKHFSENLSKAEAINQALRCFNF